MTNKKRIVTGTIVILLLSAIFHGIYEKFPNVVTSLLFPVNESIWEHNKLVFLSFLVWAICDKLFFKNDKSVFFRTFIAMIICIILLDTSFSIVYFFVLEKKHNLIITLLIYTISIIVSSIVGQRIRLKNDRKTEIYAFSGYIVVFIILSVLTYRPPHLPIFCDYTGNFYGIE